MTATGPVHLNRARRRPLRRDIGASCRAAGRDPPNTRRHPDEHPATCVRLRVAARRSWGVRPEPTTIPAASDAPATALDEVLAKLVGGRITHADFEDYVRGYLTLADVRALDRREPQ